MCSVLSLFHYQHDCLNCTYCVFTILFLFFVSFPFCFPSVCLLPLLPKPTSLPLSLPPSPSSVLTYIFMIDVALPHTQPTSSPHVAEFVTRVLECLKPLTSEAEIHNHVHEENTQETDERTQAVKLLKTGQQW